MTLGPDTCTKFLYTDTETIPQEKAKTPGKITNMTKNKEQKKGRQRTGFNDTLKLFFHHQLEIIF